MVLKALCKDSVSEFRRRQSVEYHQGTTATKRMFDTWMEEVPENQPSNGKMTNKQLAMEGQRLGY